MNTRQLGVHKADAQGAQGFFSIFYSNNNDNDDDNDYHDSKDGNRTA